MKIIKVKKLVQTCGACPTQYDMWDDENNYFYLRYRHGYMLIEMNNDIIVNGELKKQADGCCNIYHFQRMAVEQGYYFDLSEVEEEY